jgi:hypothetical protein
MEQAAKHQEELERAIQAQVSASADALQAESEALAKIKNLEAKHKLELQAANAEVIASFSKSFVNPFFSFLFLKLFYAMGRISISFFCVVVVVVFCIPPTRPFSTTIA